MSARVRPSTLKRSRGGKKRESTDLEANRERPLRERHHAQRYLYGRHGDEEGEEEEDEHDEEVHVFASVTAWQALALALAGALGGAEDARAVGELCG